MTPDPAALDALTHYTGPLSDTHRPTLADIVIATLKASGVRRIYGLPGDSLNGLTDALHRDGDITWQHVRHEEAAAFAAAGEAATTGELAVCGGRPTSGTATPQDHDLRLEYQGPGSRTHRVRFIQVVAGPPYCSSSWPSQRSRSAPSAAPKQCVSRLAEPIGA